MRRRPPLGHRLAPRRLAGAGLLAGPIGLLPVLNGQAALYLLAGLLALTILTQPSRRRRPTLASVTAGTDAPV